ncbi:MAG: 6,7-dimethyl-8-ribityllumazine synthase [Aureibaculum sp.]|nr:6,7-dimethyl-8-ribityllumazine synthase [Aureibaculum sp.]
MSSTNLSEYDKTTVPNAEHLRFGIVVSEWNTGITENLFTGAKETLLENGAKENNITRLDVPGSFELIYGCKYLLQKQKYDAIIAIGCVIQGETKHFVFVCEAVSQGIKSLNLQFDAPTIFCVLTDDTLQQSKERSGGKLGNKGVECAIAAMKMATLG